MQKLYDWKCLDVCEAQSGDQLGESRVSGMWEKRVLEREKCMVLRAVGRSGLWF